MRNQNKAVDGEPVAEQKTSLVSALGIFMARVRTEKERLSRCQFGIGGYNLVAEHLK